MEVSITKESDEVFTLLQTEEVKELQNNINNKNDSNFVDIKDTVIANINQVISNEKPAIVDTISQCLDNPKSPFDTDLLVHNTLFDMKSDEISSTDVNDKSNIDCNVKSYNSDVKNVNFCSPISTFTFNTSNETQALLSTVEATYSDINNTFVASKKQGFSIEEISKDETSQSNQSMSIYSNNYTCFLSEQPDAISNLTPFKRSNSYYFDSPVKKLCTTKVSSEEKKIEVFNNTLYSNENDKMYTGFTSIQNDLEVDCIQERYDGSDSGFGSELAEDKNSTSLDIAVSTSSLLYKNNFTLNQESSFEDLQRTSNEFLSAMEVLKPKFSDSILDTSPLEVSNKYGIVVKGILKRNKLMDYGILTSDEMTTVKKRRNINFANVTVFYFPRVQGFTCVPSQVTIRDNFFKIYNYLLCLYIYNFFFFNLGWFNTWNDKSA